MSPDVPHPSVYIEEELAARGWTRDTLAALCSIDEPTYLVNRVALDFYLEVGERTPAMYLGHEMLDKIARAFGVSTTLLRNLEAAWQDAQRQVAEAGR